MQCSVIHSFLSEASLNTSAGALQKLDQSLLSLLSLLYLHLEHFLDPVVDLVECPRQSLLLLIPLLTLLVQLFVELSDLVREDLGKDLAALFTLPILFNDSGLNLADLGAKGTFIAVATLLPRLFLLS